MILRDLRRWLYRWIPSRSDHWHAKRRKGLQSKWGGGRVLECQSEQDRIFWEKVLQKKTRGTFWEVDAGDGSTGSHGVFLEEKAGWKGAVWESCERPARTAQKTRKSEVLNESSPFPEALAEKFAAPDLLILRKIERLSQLEKILRTKSVQPTWLVIQAPCPVARVPRLLRPLGYRMIWAFHDDEYYQRSGT